MLLRRLAVWGLAFSCAAAGFLAAAPARAEGRDRDQLAQGQAPGPAGDQQRRRQAAEWLRRQGFDIDWRLATWDELHEWTLRADQARLLRERYSVVVDWRGFSVAEMKEWEGRIARSVDLRRFGVEADWRLYSARQLDDLRSYLERARAEPPRSPRAAQDLVPAEVTLGFDPDAILVPTYVTEQLSRDDTDDAILEPSFARSRRRPGARDEAGPTAKPTPARDTAPSAPASAKLTPARDLAPPPPAKPTPARDLVPSAPTSKSAKLTPARDTAPTPPNPPPTTTKPTPARDTAAAPPTTTKPTPARDTAAAPPTTKPTPPREDPTPTPKPAAPIVKPAPPAIPFN